MLLTAGTAVTRSLPNLLLRLSAPSSLPHPQTFFPPLSRFLSGSNSTAPLSLFICAVDEASDAAGGALVSALKQLSGRPVQLHGVGGKQLAFHGLESVVDEEQQAALATAEVIPPTYKLLGKDPDGVSKHSYAKLFRDIIWEAALDGCRGRTPTPSQQQGQANSSSSSSGGHVCFDAVITVGSATAAQLTLNFLRQAEKMQKAKLPVVVQYTVPGLWDPQGAAAAAGRWSKLVDHVLTSLPFEARLLHSAGVPSTFVGHPLVQQVLGSSTSTQSFGGKARLLSNLLKQQQTQQQQGSAPPQQQQQQQQQQQGSLFASGNAAAFWRSYDRAHAMQQEEAAAEAAAAAAAADQTSSTSSSSSSVSPVRPSPAKRKLPVQHHHHQQQQHQQQQQHGRLLLAMLPGETEAEVITNMAGFDEITTQLQQQHPDFIATLHVPDALVPAAVLATVNFSVPVLVVAAGEKMAADALAAAAAAVSHPGPASLAAVAAGVPLVCVRGGSRLRHAWGAWCQQGVLPFGCVPNLLLGRAAVPEVNMWDRQGLESAVGVLGQLLQAQEAAAGGASSSSGPAGQQLVAQHRAVLQEVLLQLAPPAPEPAKQPAVPGRSSSSSSSSSSTWQLPAEAAARTLLELIGLREQQEAEHRSSRAGSSSGSSEGVGKAPVASGAGGPAAAAC